MSRLNVFILSLAVATIAACGGGGGGTASSGNGGGTGGGGNGGGNNSSVEYAGFAFSNSASAVLETATGDSFAVDPLKLGSKAILDVVNSSSYSMKVMVGSSECLTDMTNKTYSMVMVKQGSNADDSTWAVLSTTANQVSFAVLKLTGHTSFTVQANNTTSDALNGLSLSSLQLSCSAANVTTYNSGGGLSWTMAMNSDVAVVRNSYGAVYVGFSNVVLPSVVSSLNMEGGYFFRAGVDDYANCSPSTGCGGTSTTTYGTISGIPFSGSGPVTTTLPAGQSATVTTATTSKGAFQVLVSPTATVMGATTTTGGRLMGVLASVDGHYVSVFAHQKQQSVNSDDILSGLGGIIFQGTP